MVSFSGSMGNGDMALYVSHLEVLPNHGGTYGSKTNGGGYYTAIVASASIGVSEPLFLCGGALKN